MAFHPIRTGGPANFRGIQYQLLWSLFHATQWKIQITSEEDFTAILEPNNGADFDYQMGSERRVEQIKSRSTGEPWSWTDVLEQVLPSLYKCVDTNISTTYAFVTETDMGEWMDAYNFFRRLRAQPVQEYSAISASLSTDKLLRVGRHILAERDLVETAITALAGPQAGAQEQLRVFHLLRGFEFLGKQDFSSIERKIKDALLNHGTPFGEVNDTLRNLIGDLFVRAALGEGKLESSGFFGSHGLAEVSLARWADILKRARRHMLDCLAAQNYHRELDVREVSAARSLFIEEPNAHEEVMRDSPRPLVEPRSVVLFTGESGQGKSWQLYRLGHELAQEEKLAILVQGRGHVDADLEEVARAFSREIWGTGSVLSLRDVEDRVRRAVPKLQNPWLTVLIDGVRDEAYALSILENDYWQRHGIRVVLGCPWTDHIGHVASHRIPVSNFTIQELSRYLKLRLGVDWIDFPNDVRNYLTLPLFARMYCDIQGEGGAWRPVNEYHLFSRAWTRQTSKAHLAASAIASLAARLPEEQVYPWPISTLWAAGLRDTDLRSLVNLGLIRLGSGGRSVEIWHDRILNWAVAEGLVSALRSGDINVDVLISRALHSSDDNSSLHRRLLYVPMDTLWLLATPEFGLDQAVDQFLTALEQAWDTRDLEINLGTLGERIVPHLFSRLASSEEDEA